jgi:hypothetical protein
MPVNTPRDYFANKPTSYKIFTLLRAGIKAQGDCKMTIESQISFGAKRKFAWIWLYNITGTNPEGTVQIMLALNKKVDEPPVYRVTQIGKKRWNHLIVVHSIAEAKHPALTTLLQAAYTYGQDSE